MINPKCIYNSFIIFIHKIYSMYKFTVLLLLFVPTFSFSQTSTLSIEKIMRDSKWMGTSPSNPFWAEDGKTLYFNWNPDNAPSDSLYYITPGNKIPTKASVQEKTDLVPWQSLQFNQNKTAFVYAKNGDIFYKNIKTNRLIQVTKTVDFEYSPDFSFNDSKIVYTSNQNLFSWDIANGETIQLTNIQAKENTPEKEKVSQQEKWLKEEQIEYLEVLKQRKEKKQLAADYNKSVPKDELRKIYTQGDRVQRLAISPDGRYITYLLVKNAKDQKRTIVPNYVTESGFTTDISGRTKVGVNQSTSTFYIYDRQADSIFQIKTDNIEGIKDLPDYVKFYPNRKEETNKVRPVDFNIISWSPDGKNLVVDIRSQDHKDRWIMKWDAQNNSLRLLDRQRNEAWIGGPGLWNTGWINNETFWFQSEATGYSHIYSVNVNSGEKKAISSGKSAFYHPG